MKKTILSLLVALMATTGAWAQIDVTDNGNGTYDFTMPAYDVEVNTELWYILKQNGETPAGNKTKANVFLDRTLKAKVGDDDAWNTFCVPFPISAEKVTALGMTVKQLSSTSFSNGTLTLDFADVTTGIEAGTPYLVKVASDLDFTADGNEFQGVSQDWTAYHEVTPGTDTGNDWVTFVPVLEKKEFTGEDKTALYLGSDNSLYYPNGAMSIKSFRAYFQLNGLTAADITNGARLFFGIGDETTGVALIDNGKLIMDNSAGANGQWSMVNGTTSRAAKSMVLATPHSQRENGQSSMVNRQC